MLEPRGNYLPGVIPFTRGKHAPGFADMLVNLKCAHFNKTACVRLSGLQ